MRCHWRDLSADGGMETEMQRFKKIVFALTTTEDDDRTVLDLAELARATNAEVRVVGLNHAQAWPAHQVLDASGWHDDLVEQARANAIAHAERVGERMRDLGVTATVRFADGRPAIAAISEAHAMDADLIAVSGSVGAAPSAIVQQLLRTSPSPVWLMRPAQNTLRLGFKRILCAVDLVDHGGAGMHLAHSTMRLARSLAEFHAAELTVLHGWHSPEPRSFLGSADEFNSSQLAGEEKHRVERVAQNRLRELSIAHALDDIGARIMLVNGKPAEAIVEAVESVRADLLILGSVGRSGILGRQIGRIGDAALGKVRCSVIAVNPDTVSTPATLEGRRESASATASFALA